jgi:hypothetical protein
MIETDVFCGTRNAEPFKTMIAIARSLPALIISSSDSLLTARTTLSPLVGALTTQLPEEQPDGAARDPLLVIDEDANQIVVPNTAIRIRQPVPVLMLRLYHGFF